MLAVGGVIYIILLFLVSRYLGPFDRHSSGGTTVRTPASSSAIDSGSVTAPEGESEISLEDSYDAVVAKIEADPMFGVYTVVKKPTKITVYTNPSSGLRQINVREYHFKSAKLVRTMLTMDYPDPNASLSYIYQMRLPQDGEPSVVTKNGQRAYLWRTKGVKQYYYSAWSDWFNKECVVLVKER